MSQKIAWITGASSGIGRALAREYNKRGFTVVLSARRKEELDITAQSLEHPKDCFVFPIDLAQHENATHWVQTVLEKFGHVDVLINNGGMGHLGTAMEMPLEEERRVMEVNFWGGVALTKELLPYMKDHYGSQIWTVASILGYFGSPELAAYAASKFAVIGYFESLQYEMRSAGVHVGIVNPGFVNTSVTLQSIGPDGKPIERNSKAQENGMDTEVFAQKFYRRASKRRPPRQLFIGRYELAAVPFKRYLPSLFFRIYGNMTDITRKKKY
ncbi:MAG: hypothetical protein RL754_150 [Bacteroidota bacterium]|jgi:short-subunit dehydrogenase